MRQEQDTAKKITAILNQGVSSLNKETVDSLAAARHRAVAVMPEHVSAAEAALAGMGRLVNFHLYGRRLWISVLGLLGIIIMMAMLMQTAQNREPVDADALLLGSDLPPEAYLDKGFDTWLEQSSRR